MTVRGGVVMAGVCVMSAVIGAGGVLMFVRVGTQASSPVVHATPSLFQVGVAKPDRPDNKAHLFAACAHGSKPSCEMVGAYLWARAQAGQASGVCLVSKGGKLPESQDCVAININGPRDIDAN